VSRPEHSPAEALGRRIQKFPPETAEKQQTARVAQPAVRGKAFASSMVFPGGLGVG
jgi:hypothetical protein